MGSGAGVHGGHVVAQGTPEEVAADPASLTGQYLSGHRAITLPSRRTPPIPGRALAIRGARGNNLRGLDVEIPLGLMTGITGVSGSGKSTLINDTLYRCAARRLNGANTTPAPGDSIEGLHQPDKVVAHDQGPLGGTPRAHPAR